MEIQLYSHLHICTFEYAYNMPFSITAPIHFIHSLDHLYMYMYLENIRHVFWKTSVSLYVSPCVNKTDLILIVFCKYISN